MFIVSWWHTGGAQISPGSEEHFHVTQHVWPITQHATHSLFFLDTPTLCHVPTIVVSSSDSVPPHPACSPRSLYFWHQTFWARRPQHNVNYSAWLARGWERIINRRWSQAISYGWPWLNTNAQNHFQTHTNIRFHYLQQGEWVFDLELACCGLFVVFKCALCACTVWHVQHLWYLARHQRSFQQRLIIPRWMQVVLNGFDIVFTSSDKAPQGCLAKCKPTHLLTLTTLPPAHPSIHLYLSIQCYVTISSGGRACNGGLSPLLCYMSSLVSLPMSCHLSKLFYYNKGQKLQKIFFFKYPVISWLEMLKHQLSGLTICSHLIKLSLHHHLHTSWQWAHTHAMCNGHKWDLWICGLQ